MIDGMLPDPTFEVPDIVATALEGVKVGGKVKGASNYVVVEKNEHGVWVKLTHLTFNRENRIV